MIKLMFIAILFSTSVLAAPPQNFSDAFAKPASFVKMEARCVMWGVLAGYDANELTEHRAAAQKGLTAWQLTFQGGVATGIIYAGADYHNKTIPEIATAYYIQYCTNRI